MKYYLLLLGLTFCGTCLSSSSTNDDKGEVLSAPEDEAIIDEIIKINEGANRKDLVEGDILIEYSGGHTNRMLKRDATRGREYLWRNKIVPYEIASDLQHAADLIKNSMKEFEIHTCLKFLPRTSEPNWINFVMGDGCYSSVGKVYWRPGPQDISLAIGCLKKGTIMHEIMHALGFWHEQSRPDRNKYVEIFWENIKPTEITNFNRYSHQVTDVLGVEYDYGSIMHYGRKAFSKNKKPTIIALRNTTEKLGQRESLSPKDVIQLNAMYDCKGSPRGSWSAWSDYGPCDGQCYKKKQRFCFHSNPKQCQNANDYGVESKLLKCSNAECYAPVPGHWGRWQAWSNCDKDCGPGKRNRIRVCDDPEPKNGGNDCVGPKIQFTSCIIKSCGLGLDDCEFDGQRWCFWKNDIQNNNNYFWSRAKDPTPSGNTGPSQDHTSGKGHYLYTESSAPAAAGNKARLLSKTLKSKGTRCLVFWYHMFGHEMGALRVFLQQKGGLEKRLWQKQGDQGDQWRQAEVTIESANPYRIIFESERGTSFLSDLAIDDVFFKSGGCSKVRLLSQTCPLNVSKVGCYLNSSLNNGFDILIDNHRDKHSSLAHGFFLDWHNYSSSIETLMCHCAARAKAQSFKVFSIHYYGECWGFRHTLRLNQYTVGSGCVDGYFKPCRVDNGKTCTGTDKEHYIYTVN